MTPQLLPAACEGVRVPQQRCPGLWCPPLGGWLTGCRNPDPIDMGQLLARTLLDDDLPARLQVEVTRGAGGSHIEGDAVVLGGDG